MVLSRRILLSGDMQGGGDALLLSGDMAGGVEVTNDIVSGGELSASDATTSGAAKPLVVASAVIISSTANAEGIVDVSSLVLFAAGNLAAHDAQGFGNGTSSVTGSGNPQAGSAGMAIFGGAIVGSSGVLLSDPAMLETVLKVLADASGDLLSSVSDLSGVSAALISGSGSLESRNAAASGAAFVLVGAEGSLQSLPSSFSAPVQTTDGLIVTAGLYAAPPNIDVTVRAKVEAIGDLGATAAQIDAAVSAIASAAGQMQAEAGTLNSGVSINLRASGNLAAGLPGIIAEIVTESARRTVIAIFY